MDTSSRQACSAYEALLEDYLSGDLNAADAARASNHLKECARCCEAFDAAGASVRLLRVAEATGDPGPGFARNVIARVRAEQERTTERTSFWQPFVWLGWRFAVTATLALGLLLTYDARWAKRPQPNVAGARLIVVRDIFPLDQVRTPANGDEALLMVADTSHGN